MLSAEQVTTMLSMQASMNAKVDPDWVSARYPYLRAVAMEGAEAIEHHGWKWWKEQKKDLPQLQMELIDIWHFMLSEILLRNQSSEDAPFRQLMEQLRTAHTRRIIYCDNQYYQLDKLDLVSKLELLIALSLSRRMELGVFAALLEDCELSWTELYRQYVGKNVLNMFRQDKGYKQGIYRKIWNGREDNEYLVEIIHSLDPDSRTFKDDIYSALKAAYPA